MLAIIAAMDDERQIAMETSAMDGGRGVKEVQEGRKEEEESSAD